MNDIWNSDVWATFQELEGNSVIRDAAIDKDGNGWQYLAVEEKVSRGPFSVTRLYTGYSPTFSADDDFEHALESLEHAAAQRNDTYVRVEPKGVTAQADEHIAEILQARGYHHVHHINPADTWLLDVSIGEEALLAQMDRSQRKQYRKAIRNGIEFRTSHDLNDVHELARMLGFVEQRNGVHLRPEDRLYKQAEALLPTDNGRIYLAIMHDEDGSEKVIAGIFAFVDNDTVYLIHGGSDKAYAKTGANAGTYVHIILEAAREGKKWVDFFGIAPADADDNHPWAGLTKFKQTFGGMRRTYVGTWEKPIHRGKYALYSIARKILAHR